MEVRINYTIDPITAEFVTKNIVADSPVLFIPEGNKDDAITFMPVPFANFIKYFSESCRFVLDIFVKEGASK